MANPLIGLEKVLGRLAEETSYLPATGGAVEDLLHPEIEEREDKFVNFEEKVFETIIETEQTPLYRPAPPLLRSEQHLFRYFLDGSFRSYFIGTALEHERDTPVHFAQIGAAVIWRMDDGDVEVDKVEVNNLLLLAQNKLSEGVWQGLEGEVNKLGQTVKLVDISVDDQITKHYSAEVDPRTKSVGKVTWKMHELEMKLIMSKAEACSDWLVADGSLMFEPLLSKLGALAEPRVIGVVKSFRRDPQFSFGKGQKTENFNIVKLLANLPNEHRTAAFGARSGKVAFWYVRIREQRHLDYPLMGVVKVEMANTGEGGVDSELVDLISRAIVGERSVTPYGLDRRWHVHLYPIHLCEEVVKNALLSREVVRAGLRMPVIKGV